MIKKILSFFFLAVYFFGSNILSHNIAMHVFDYGYDYTSEIIEDSCCDETEESDSRNCFTKCFDEYTKIFSYKLGLQRYKILSGYKEFLLSDFFVTYNNKKLYEEKLIIDENNVNFSFFLDHYIGIVKQTLYA